MPHRLTTPLFSYCLEAIALGLALTYNGMSYVISSISDRDWNIMKGPEGALFLAVCGLVALWLNNLSNAKARTKEREEHDSKEDIRREKEEKAREARHLENQRNQKEIYETITQLSVEGMRVSMKVDSTLQEFIKQQHGRTCSEVNKNFLQQRKKPADPVPTQETK